MAGADHGQRGSPDSSPPNAVSTVQDPGSAPLSRRHRAGLVILAVVLVAFGVITELRGAFQHTRKTDAGVYFRAAWAVRAGTDLYRVQDDNGWHYLYPPLFAIVMAPLADPPTGADRSGMLPYAVSLGLWYLVSCLCLFAAVHVLAGALEETCADLRVREQPRFCLCWWALRLVPMVICLVPIGRNLARGQVGMVLLLLLCGTAAAMIRGHRRRAGLWLAAAIALKIIPALLLLVPLQRRDWRMLSGCVVGLALGLILIPAAVLGPTQTVKAYQSVVQEVLQPGLEAATGGSRGKELTSVVSTDSNSPQVVVHNLLYPNRDSRPREAATAARVVHWSLALVLIGLSCAAARGRHGSGTPWSGSWNRQGVLELASLSLVMLVVSPVYHPHYFSLAVFPVMLLLAMDWEELGYPLLRRSYRCLFVAIGLAHALTTIPWLWPLRDFGLVLLATLWLWWVCINAAVRSRR